jgi:hypothetical protein
MLTGRATARPVFFFFFFRAVHHRVIWLSSLSLRRELLLRRKDWLAEGREVRHTVPCRPQSKFVLIRRLPEFSLGSDLPGAPTSKVFAPVAHGPLTADQPTLSKGGFGKANPVY